MVSHYLELKIVGVDSSIMQLQWTVSRREKVTWDGWNVLTLRMLPASFLSRVVVCGEFPRVVKQVFTKEDKTLTRAFAFVHLSSASFVLV